MLLLFTVTDEATLLLTLAQPCRSRMAKVVKGPLGMASAYAKSGPGSIDLF